MFESVDFSKMNPESLRKPLKPSKQNVSFYLTIEEKKNSREHV